MRRRQTVLAVLAFAGCLGILSGCGNATADCPPEASADLVAESAGIALPQPLPLDLSRIDVEAVGTHYEGPVRFLSDVLRGDWAQARAYWARLAAIEDPSERMRQVYRLKFMLQRRGMYFHHAAQAWLRAEPDSPAARLLLGVAWADAAVNARGGSYSSQVAPAQMAIFEQRFEKARPHLEAIAGRNDVHASLAHAFLQVPYFYLGESDKGWATIEALVVQAPQYGWLYFWAADYAKPKWAGARGPQRLRQLEELASRHGLNAADRKVLDQDIGYVQADLDHQPNPQAWRPYWEKRNAEAPHLYNLLQWLGHEHSVRNWPVVERLATQALALNPHQTYSLYLRHQARKEMGRGGEALRDAVAAAVLGDDDAMQTVINAHLQGTMGVAPGDHQGLIAYCRMGAAFGLPAAANCIGSMYVDGAAGLPRDTTQGVAWHLLAARGGHDNSQHDVGVLLPRVAPGQPAQDLAGFWMREAARQGHQYARHKLGPRAARPECEAAPFKWRLAQKLLELVQGR